VFRAIGEKYTRPICFRSFSSHHFAAKHESGWDEAIHFYGHRDPYREIITTKARQWIEKLHLDRLRLDAAEWIDDESEAHVSDFLIGQNQACMRLR
jgi:1,4-alpha-glucan branching enzyme